MSVRRRVVCITFGVIPVAIGCRERSPAPIADTAASITAPPVSTPVVRVNPGWDSTAGRALFLSRSDSPHSALVVLPDLTDSTVSATKRFDIGTLSGLAVELFAKRGRTGSASIVTNDRSNPVEGCLSWPQAQLSGATSADWRIALEKGRATGIRLDSLEGLPPADSAALARQITAAASAIHTKTDSVFVGIPFAVQHAYRFTVSGSVVVFAVVVRKINEEANPREERVVLVLERPAGGSMTVAYQSRSAGPEEELQTTEMLAAVSFTSGNRPGIFISSEYEDGGNTILLERTGAVQWRSVWRSAYTGC